MNQLNNTLHLPISLADSEIHLWLIDEQDVINAGVIGNYPSLVSMDELQRSTGFKSSKRRQQFLITRAALRSILSFYMPSISPQDFRFSVNPFGKPALEGSLCNIQFNVSHSHSKILIGISAEGFIGVDIEFINRKRDIFKIAEHYFHHQEWNSSILQEVEEPVARFYQLWTLKEAFIKAQGKGLSIPLNSFFFDNCHSHYPTLNLSSSLSPPKKSWIFSHAFVDIDYSLAIAVDNTQCTEALKLVVRKYIPLHSCSMTTLGKQ